MHDADDRMRASFGAMRIACSIMPGTPTASKITSVPHAVDLAPRLDRRRLARVDDHVGAELLGERRRLREKSAATIGPMPRILSSAMHARPTGPQPSTMALSSPVIRLLATACTPTASGSVSAAMLGAEARRAP